jgi:hypothetical protein
VNVLACKQGYFIATVPVEHAKKGESVAVVGLFAALKDERPEVELCGMSVLHANAPALHGRHTPDELVILALFRNLVDAKRVMSAWIHNSMEGSP